MTKAERRVLERYNNLNLHYCMVNRWLGVSAAGESGSASCLTVRGRLLTIDSTSHINVRRDSSSSCLPLLARRENRTERTVLICLFQTLEAMQLNKRKKTRHERAAEIEPSLISFLVSLIVNDPK